MIRPKKRFDFKSIAPIGLFLMAFGFTIYPVIISPILDSSRYREIQKIGRHGIKQEEIQPGGMKIWSDPFDKK